MKHPYNVVAGFAAVAALGLLLTGPVVVGAAEKEVDAPVDSRAQAANINTSRSNKGRSNNAEDAAAPAATGDCDDANDCRVPPGIAPAAVSGAPTGTAAAAPAQDYNSSRSNKARGIRDDVSDEPCPDCEEACKDCASEQPEVVSPRR